MLGRMVEKTNRYYTEFRESQEGRSLSKIRATDNKSIILPLLSKSPKTNKSVSVDPKGNLNQFNSRKNKIIPIRSKLSNSQIESEEKYSKLGTSKFDLVNGNSNAITGSCRLIL
jgi:hypothetical protein